MFDYQYYTDEVGDVILLLSNIGISRKHEAIWNYKTENIKKDPYTGGLKIFNQYLPRLGQTEGYKLNHIDLKNLPNILEELEKFKLFVKEQEGKEVENSV